MKALFKVRLAVLCLLWITISWSCKENEEDILVPETGTVTDIENNTYRTVKIGNKWWMAENLKTRTFSNGEPIAQLQLNNVWVDTIPAYCLYDENESAPGLLYNWYAVSSDKKLAPEGWRIPTDDDWKELEMFLGMSQADAAKNGWRGSGIGEKLKIEGDGAWLYYQNVWGTNESGFSAEAGACRLFDGRWGEPGLKSTGFWWTLTESASISNSIYRYLDYKSKSVFRSNCSKYYGYSVRCVKD